MQFASFDLGDPIHEAFGLRFSLQLVTLENLYGLAPERTRIAWHGDELRLHCDRLAFAGQQQRAEGELQLRLRREAGSRLRASLQARGPAPLRAVKLWLRDLDLPLRIQSAAGAARAVGEHGELLVHPTSLFMPALCLDCGGAPLGLRAEDREVRPKRFAAYVERTGPLTGRGAVELIHEEAASRFSSGLEAPDWVIEPGSGFDAVQAAHLGFLESELGLATWERRRDVPGWARELRLVATLHGMHWTGRVFLRYDEMLEILRFLSARLPGRHILAYLPGWEGRYYWQYGDYRPEPRLGGEAGFAALCEGARRLGVHLMPMFGANCANLRLPGPAGLPAEAVLASATGNRFHGNQPDWDLARAHDTGWQAWFNPGHPAWRAQLAGGIETLAARFGFDAVFLDTIHAWTNDPHHPVTAGIRALVERLHEIRPGLLLAAEADYDALLPLFPLFQRPWWAPTPAASAPYVRRFGHLCEGEPRGLTGVHEAGVHHSDAWHPGPGTLPTIAFQDGTLEACRPALELRLQQLAEAGD